MRFDAFSRAAHEAFESIPEEFREGVDGLVIRAERVPHPTLPEVHTLGQCITEAYPSDWHGPETLRSVVVLYHGSFQALAEEDPDFDWEGELWETLTHELRHHLESLANEDDLEGVDYAMDEAFHRAEGQEFDPFYYQSGVEIAPGLFQVEYDFFLEQVWTREGFEATREISFQWHGLDYRVPRPETLGDLHYLWVTGVEVGPGTLQLVLVRRRSWWERLRGLRGGRGLELMESTAVAKMASADGGMGPGDG
jgi:predicted Zn-dependent protease with MMP-like domain